MGNYTSGEESFPLDVFDDRVDPDYSPPEADPGRPVVFGLDGAVSQDAMALVGVDGCGDVVYAKAWYPPAGGTIDHRLVLCELIDLSRRFAIQEVAHDPSQIHMLAVEALSYGVPMRSVSQAAGRGGGVIARHTTTLLEALHSGQIRFFVCPELRDHLANARFSARSGGDRLVKASASKKIDLAVALTMAVGALYDRAREQLLRPVEVYEYMSAEEYLISQGIQPTDLSSEPEVSEYFSEHNWPSGDFRSDDWYDEW